MLRHGLAVAVVLSSVFPAAGCGGKDKGPSGPQEQMTDSGPAALTIPKVDPELCDARGKKVETFDLNRDNQADVWKLYKSVEQGGTRLEILTCKQVDYDHDGRKDYVAIYSDTGEMIAEEFDFTFEGRIDARRHYDRQTGRKVLVERDSDHDKKPDVWEKYNSDGLLESVRRDSNGDGKPDIWEEYDNGVLVAILYDDDYDQRVDRREVRAVPGDDGSQATETEEERPEIVDEAKPEGDKAVDDGAKPE